MCNFDHSLQRAILGILVTITLLMIINSQPSTYAATDDIDCNASNLICKAGAITGTESWSADKIYVITSDVTVGPGATLTIAPGTIIKFRYGCCSFNKYHLLIEGMLQVNGTANQKVYFTSSLDDAIGGDTNNDGGATQPRAGDWNNIIFKQGSQGVMTFTEIRYADAEKGGAVRLEGSSPTLTQLTIKHSAWAAISALPTDAPTITNFAAEDNGLNGMEMRGGALTNNATWNQSGIVYLLTNQLTIGNAATLTIQPGVVVKVLYGCCSFNKYGLTVEGALNINGTAAQKVYFTSTLDDAIGGDTNSDGGATQPKAGDWNNLVFKRGAQGVLKHLEVRFSDAEKGGALHLDGSSPTLENFTVKHSAWAAISALPTDAPVITNFAAEDVVLAGMEMRGGALTTSTTWNQVGIVYLLTNDFTIGNGATLTIAPGVIVKLLYGCCSFNKQSLQVEGALTVSGSSSQKVYFTSTRDDAIGGDTNNDAGGSQPQAGDWETIQFLAGSQGNFAHTVIRYGSISRTTGALHIKDATVTMTNSVISNNFIGLFAEGVTAEVQAQMTNTPASVSKSGLYSNAEYDVFAQAGASVVADNNWWGSSNPQPKVSGNVTTANPCADEACTTTIKPGGLYLPLVRR